jgi:hypothetical protein
MFERDTLTNSVLEGKAIVYFSRVLGIYPYELPYCTAYNYTPYLAAQMWVSRLITLDYVLLLRAYSTLDNPWPTFMRLTIFLVEISFSSTFTP